jgi:hypothetical protein
LQLGTNKAARAATRTALWLGAIASAAALAYGQAPAATPSAAPVQAAPATVTAAPAPAAQGGTIRGTVVAGTAGKPGGVPLPGVAITATNTLTGKKYTGSTDIDGVYILKIPRNGRYVVKAELTGFALATQEVVLSGVETQAAAQGITILPKNTDFGLQLASRAEAAATRQAALTGSATGTQSLSLNSGELDASSANASTGNNGAAMPTLANLNDSVTGSSAAAAEDTITVSGSAGQTNGLAGFSEDEIRDRIQNAVDQGRASGMIPQGGDPTSAIVSMLGGMMGGGGPGGGGRGSHGGGGGGFGSRGGGAFRNFNPAQPHGSIFYQGGNSALNSGPWSPSLTPVSNPSAYSNRFGASIAGSPYIPGLTQPNTKEFVFLNLTGQKNLNAFLANGRVPTALERTGDFSQSTLGNGADATAVKLYNPINGSAISNNCLVATCASGPGAGLTLSPQAVALLNYYPAPNIPLNAQGYNYQTISNAGSNNVAINTRFVQTLGQSAGSPFGGMRSGGRGSSSAPPSLRQNINVGYNYSHSASDSRNIFLPLGGAVENGGNSLSVGYTIGYGRLSNSATLSWNRNNAETRNYFTNTSNNPSTTAGVTVPNQTGGFADPSFYNGLPTLTISNFHALTNATPSDVINQTISFSDFVAWRRKHHNFRFGLDVRRVHADSIGGNNPLGSFDFTGYATASTADQAAGTAGVTSGDGFADFLLGLPQSTSLQAGLYKTYLRENVYDWYVQDDWHAASNLTAYYGLRYEYFGPYTEKDNHLANLAPNTPFTAGVIPSVSVVNPGQDGYPNSLVNPDYGMYAPRFGLAYRLKNSGLTRDTVLRGGYGINYNTGQYAVFAKSLAHQSPVANTQTNTLTSGCTTLTPATPYNAAHTMTLASGFNCSTASITNNDAVDKNYRLGMVQVYNLNLQKTIGLGIVLNLGYAGSHGSNLDVVGSPNATPTGVITPGVEAFDYEFSGATSRSNQLVFSAQKRMQKGIALGATYTYSHSIDDASGVGGAVGAPIQNFYNLRAEEGNSSFDQRHNVNGNWVLELPFGPNRAYFNKGGILSHALDGFDLSGNFTFATGTYFTPQYSGNQQEANSGNTFTQRPDRILGQPLKGPGSVKQWFNTAAFAAPVTGSVAHYGSASPGSIEGPGTVSVSASLSRTFELGDTRSFEARVTASNVFNTVQYSGIDTNENSATFGEVTSAAAMRTLLVQARYRF